ncbi:MAG: hypothetical protein WA621_01425 [Candidatus Acidiferrum sp.]
MSSGADLLRRSDPFGSGVGSRNSFSAGAKDFHRAFEQTLKLAAFDSRTRAGGGRALRDYNGVLFFYAKVGKI